MASLIALAIKAQEFLRGIPAKVWAWLAVAAVTAALALWVQHKVETHLKYVQKLEQTKRDLSNENSRLGLEISGLRTINSNNQLIYKASLDQANNARRIAEQARVDAEKRAERYRSIRNELDAIPPADRQSVDPVIRGVIERLWDDETPGT